MPVEPINPSTFAQSRAASAQQSPEQAADHSASDIEPIPYRVHSSAWPIGYSLASQDADELPMRARKAGAL